jgi:hypothetical protein
VSHRSAVEQIIAVIEASGATLLMRGKLEIDFSQNDLNDHRQESASVSFGS